MKKLFQNGKWHLKEKEKWKTDDKEGIQKESKNLTLLDSGP